MTTDRSTLSTDAHSSDATDSTRRDALARTLCARLCDERKSIDVLLVVDELLSRLEREDLEPAAESLARCFYVVEPGCSKPEYRAGWNAAIAHALRTLQVEAGLAELRRQTNWPGDLAVRGAPFDEPPIDPLPPAPSIARTRAITFDVSDDEEPTQ